MRKLPRRRFLKRTGQAALLSSLDAGARTPCVAFPAVRTESRRARPNILFLMTDQQRFDTIHALGNPHIFTPHLDRLVQRGIAFTNAYSTCPVCVPARTTIRTGCEPPTTRIFSNSPSRPAKGQAADMEGRCGPYLARVLRSLGYRTFGIGKFHTPGRWDLDIGYEVHLHSEELYATPEQRRRDAYAAWLHKNHPYLDYIEGLMGERTEMYYMPQLSPEPAEATVEGWAAAKACEEILRSDRRPFFGFVSFIGPHPPFAPPIPFNRIYDPDRMPDPIKGDLSVDHADEQIPFMNRLVWAEDISDGRARVLKARYYGEITYIDMCIGRILEALEARPDSENTLICFFADHGDHLGDHHAWQKESFFEASCHIPYLVSWPAELPGGRRRADLVCLTDLFGLATSAAGRRELRQGIDLLGLCKGKSAGREELYGWYGEPGTLRFKAMVRRGEWKYIYIANGGREQLFNLKEDPNELRSLAAEKPRVLADLKRRAIAACRHPGAKDALEGDTFKAFPYTKLVRPRRIYQFDRSRGIKGFPKHPSEVLRKFGYRF